jgi:hypothetical protein
MAGAQRAGAQHIVVVSLPGVPDIWGDFAGTVLGVINDANADGCGDFVINAPYDQAPSDLRVGRAYIISGADGAILRMMTQPATNEPLDGFAQVLGSVIDINGDGVDDVAVSAQAATEPGGPVSSGIVHFFSGASGALLLTLGSPHPSTAGNFGTAPAITIGDVTGDGRPEIAVGAHADFEDGQVYVFETEHFGVVRQLGATPSYYFGDRLGYAGDMTGDGVPDVLVVASRERITPGSSTRGVTYLFSGADGQMIRRMPGPSGMVTSIMDVNADGVRDIVAGVSHASPPGYDQSDGVVMVVSGATGELIRTMLSPSREEAGDFGTCVSAVQDIDADGVDDIVIGDRHATFAGRPRASGAVYIYSGATGVMLRRMLSPRPVENGLFGASIAVIPDANHDGCPEIAVGAPFEQTYGGGPRQAYIFHSCAADFDGSGTVDSADFFLFLQRFFANAAPADFNRDGDINSGDFFDLLVVFFGGCG